MKREQFGISTAASGVAIASLGLALAALASLHVLSPEFSPAWRMISEYANGGYAWVLSIMFVGYGVGLLALAVAVRGQVTTRAGKVGLVCLALAGLGAWAAAVFDLNQEALHELAGFFGILFLPIAAMLITTSLVRTEPWSEARKPLLWLANLTWISLVLWVASFILMVATFVLVLGGLPTAVPKYVPPGAIALVGWTNRLMVLAAWGWVAGVAWFAIRFARRAAEVPIAAGRTLPAPGLPATR